MISGSCEKAYLKRYAKTIPTARIPGTVLLVSNKNMNEVDKIKQIRLNNFLFLLKNQFNNNKTAFARALDRPAPNIHRILKEEVGIGEDLARHIELQTGQASLWLDQDHTNEPPNVRPTRSMPRFIPVLSYVQAGAWTEVIDYAALGEDTEWVVSDYRSGKKLFCLRVQGDSMEPEFPEGTLLVVEPGADWRAGHYVIAANGDHEATFKQVARDGDAWFLKPCNPRYPIQPLTAAHRIIGVVVQTVRNLGDRRAEK